MHQPGCLGWRDLDSIRENATSQHGEIGLVWHAAFDEADPIRQSSGLDAVVAALRVAGVRWRGYSRPTSLAWTRKPADMLSMASSPSRSRSGLSRIRVSGSARNSSSLMMPSRSASMSAA